MKSELGHSLTSDYGGTGHYSSHQGVGDVGGLDMSSLPSDREHTLWFPVDEKLVLL